MAFGEVPSKIPRREMREGVKETFREKRRLLKKELERRKDERSERKDERKAMKERTKKMKDYEKNKATPDNSYRASVDSQKGEGEGVSSTVHWMKDPNDRIFPPTKDNKEVWIKAPQPLPPKTVRDWSAVEVPESTYAFHEKVKAALDKIAPNRGVIVEEEAPVSNRFGVSWIDNKGEIKKARVVNLDTTYILLGATRDKNETFDSLYDLFNKAMQA